MKKGVWFELRFDPLMLNAENSRCWICGILRREWLLIIWPIDWLLPLEWLFR